LFLKTNCGPSDKLKQIVVLQTNYQLIHLIVYRDHSDQKIICEHPLIILKINNLILAFCPLKVFIDSNVIKLKFIFCSVQIIYYFVGMSNFI